MAAVDLASVTNALATIFEDDIVSQFNRATVLSKLLPFKEGESKNLAWDVEFGTVPADASLAEGANVSTYNDDTIVPAVLNWGTYAEAFQVTGKALAAAAATRNPDELANLFAEKMERAVQRLTAAINKDWYSGPGTGDRIMGLTATNGGLKATGIYAGIDRSVQTLWAGNELLNGGVARANSFDLMRDAKRTIYVASGEMPDLIICDPTQHENYGKLFGQFRRYVNEITLRGQKVTLDGGYQALEFDGIPVIADIHCPAGQMLFLNSKYTRIRQLPDAMAAVQAAGGQGAGGMIRLHGTPEEQYGAGNVNGLTARIIPLAVNGDKYSFQLSLYPQLQVRRPNANAVLGDLL